MKHSSVTLDCLSVRYRAADRRITNDGWIPLLFALAGFDLNDGPTLVPLRARRQTWRGPQAKTLNGGARAGGRRTSRKK